MKGYLRRVIFLTLIQFPIFCENISTLFQDLALVEKIERQEFKVLPFFYNTSMVGGYFTMPSSRHPNDGQAGIGISYLPPYRILAASFKCFSFIETSLNYRIYQNMLDPVFGDQGFGNMAERTANFKIIINPYQQKDSILPIFAIGVEDFFGTKKFKAEYITATKCFFNQNLEVTLGWGRKRIHGLFGGFVWTPWKDKPYNFLKNFSFIAEYDANDYQENPGEHPEGRKVSSRINTGFAWKINKYLQLNAYSIRGEKLAVSSFCSLPLSTTEGLIPKTQEILLYEAPIDTEPLGMIRPKFSFINELVSIFSDQGLKLYEIRLEKDNKLWIKASNLLFRDQRNVRHRLQRIFSIILPSNISEVIVSIEAQGILCHTYYFQQKALFDYKDNKLSEYEFNILSPLKNPTLHPREAELLYKKRKDLMKFTFYPDMQTFLGNSKGKLKYNLSLTSCVEGYINNVYYEAQFSYGLKSTTGEVQDFDCLNPSQLPNVRTDAVKYYPIHKICLDVGYVQKNWNLFSSCFSRIAFGYFEPAYAGAAWEILYYPVENCWAVGLEQAFLRKRYPHQLKLCKNIRRLNGFTPSYQPFQGLQYFLSFYYSSSSYKLDFIAKIGKFLANDYGIRFQFGRWFANGLNLSIWYTATNGKDRINGKIYHDKGFILSIPFEFFLNKESRNHITYKMSAWLRDVGAFSETGKTLYPIVYSERLNL